LNTTMTAPAVAGMPRLILRLEGLALLSAAALRLKLTGFDRVLGYGLKYATAFSDTHLGRIGRNRTGA